MLKPFDFYRCMILRTDGELSLLDLDQGNERRLVSGIERFWLSWGRPKEEAELIKEVPWWAYGHRGMQVCICVSFQMISSHLTID